MAEYYTMETVREQIIKKSRAFSTAISSFPIEWDYCPCITEKKCKKLNEPPRRRAAGYLVSAT
jgi:hypothetical protein